MAANDLDIPSHWLDPVWRLTNLYYIQDENGNRVKFEPREAQLAFLKSTTGVDLILKARQLGFTTLMALVGTDEAVFFDNWNVAIIAHTRPHAEEIFRTKVKYPYMNLPEEIRNHRQANSDRAGLLRLNNDSSIFVTSSGRSGSVQRLHISEMGKICAKMPEKAREVITGSIPALNNNNITVESTAEGQEGWFYDKCFDAMAGRGRYNFSFYPWFDDKRYVMEPSGIRVAEWLHRYFDELEVKVGKRITPQQRAWYANMEYDLGGDMKREYPSFPEEAFEAAIEGAYFSNQMLHLEHHKKIGRFPIDPTYPVNTFWDLGMNDATTIWFHQFINGRNRFVSYYENSGEEISHYIKHVRQWAEDNGATLGRHYWPHDGARQDLFVEGGRLQIVERKYQFRPSIVSRTPSKLEAIEAARSVMPSCDFDDAACAIGLKHLREYRKEWDERRGVWRDRPLHNSASHGADGFMTFATGFTPPIQFEPAPMSVDVAMKMGRARPYEIEEDDDDGLIGWTPNSF